MTFTLDIMEKEVGGQVAAGIRVFHHQVVWIDSFGNKTVKAVPPPSSLSTEIEPRWASTMLLTIESPRPVPTI